MLCADFVETLRRTDTIFVIHKCSLLCPW